MPKNVETCRWCKKEVASKEICCGTDDGEIICKECCDTPTCPNCDEKMHCNHCGYGHRED